MAGVFRSSPPQINLYNDISFYVPLAWGPIVYSYYCCKNIPSYVIPPRKPKIFGDYRDVVEYMFKTWKPVSYTQNVKCELSSKVDGENKCKSKFSNRKKLCTRARRRK